MVLQKSLLYACGVFTGNTIQDVDKYNSDLDLKVIFFVNRIFDEMPKFHRDEHPKARLYPSTIQR